MDGTDLMDISLSKLWELVMDREVWHAAVHEVTELDTNDQLNNSSSNMIMITYSLIFSDCQGS